LFPLQGLFHHAFSYILLCLSQFFQKYHHYWQVRLEADELWLRCQRSVHVRMYASISYYHCNVAS
jgi:hypothetical protein